MSSELPKEKVLLWGIGVTGQSMLELLKSQRIEVLTIDKKSGYDFTEETIPYKELDIKAVIKSPGVPWTHPAWDYFEEAKIPVMGDIEWVWRYSNVPVLAITGSNGKSTTVNMISHALSHFKTKHFLGGNIGTPYAKILLDEKYKDAEYAVIEVSSFQLETIRDFKPEVSAILNVSENHMERYRNIEEYAAAKKNIYKNEPEFHFNFDDEDYREFVSNFNFQNMKVRGDHNKKNFYFCYKVLEAIHYEEGFQEIIDSFPGVPHRLEYCGQKKGVQIYNDSKSTNLESTLTAVKSFDQNVVLIIGGKLREHDVSGYAELAKYAQVKSIWLYGESAFFLKDVLPNAERYETLDDIVVNIKTTPGDYVLLSPGFPSFDQFNNFEHRGEYFKKLLKL